VKPFPSVLTESPFRIRWREGRGRRFSGDGLVVPRPTMGGMFHGTHLLDPAAGGGRPAAPEVLPPGHEGLRKPAAGPVAARTPAHTLQPTALVHEAYLRLVGGTDQRRWDNRGHFFAAAAEAMRRILVEAARRKHGPEHGGHLLRQDLDPEYPAGPDRSAR